MTNDTIVKLRQAATAGKTVDFTYHGKDRKVLLEKYDYNQNGEPYVVGFDENVNGFRSFHTAEVENLRVHSD